MKVSYCLLLMAALFFVGTKALEKGRPNLMNIPTLELRKGFQELRTYFKALSGKRDAIQKQVILIEPMIAILNELSKRNDLGRGEKKLLDRLLALKVINFGQIS